MPLPPLAIACIGWTTLYKDLDPGKDKKYIGENITSSTLKNLGERIEKPENDQKLTGYAIKRFQRCRSGIGQQIRAWKDGKRKFDRGVLFQLALALIFVILPSVAGGLLNEPEYVARNAPNRLRSLIQWIVMAWNQYTRWRLVWQTTKERAATTMPIVVFYSVPAIISAARPAYGTVWYTALAIGTTFLWMIEIQFGNIIRRKIERSRTRDQSRELTEAHRSWLLAEQDAYLSLRAAFHKESEPYKKSLSKNGTNDLGLFKRDLDEIIEIFDDCLLKTTPPLNIEPLGPKLIVFILAACVVFLNTYPFWGEWFLFSQSSIWGISTLGQLALTVFDPHQTIGRVSNQFSNLAAANAYGTFMVPIPMLATHKKFMKKNKNFAISISVLAFLVLVCSDIIVPAAMKLWDVIKWLWARRLIQQVRHFVSPPLIWLWKGAGTWLTACRKFFVFCLESLGDFVGPPFECLSDLVGPWFAKLENALGHPLHKLGNIIISVIWWPEIITAKIIWMCDVICGFLKCAACLHHDHIPAGTAV